MFVNLTLSNVKKHERPDIIVDLVLYGLVLFHVLKFDLKETRFFKILIYAADNGLDHIISPNLQGRHSHYLRNNVHKNRY